MAIIKCPECGRNISDQAEICIDCGYEIRSNIEKAKKEKQKHRNRVIVAVLSICIPIIALISSYIFFFAIPQKELYAAADALIASQQYAECVEILRENKSEEKANSAVYKYAMKLFGNEQYEDSAELFILIKDYQDSSEKAVEAHYIAGSIYLDTGNYEEAIVLLKKCTNYLDADSLKNEAFYLWGTDLMGVGDYDEAASKFKSAGKYQDSEALKVNCMKKQLDKYMAENNFIEYINYRTQNLRLIDGYHSAIQATQYDSYYNSIIKHFKIDSLYQHTVASKLSNQLDYFSILPNTYKDLHLIEEFYKIACSKKSPSLTTLQVSDLKPLWGCDQVQKLLTADNNIFDFMLGNWYGGGYYFIVTANTNEYSHYFSWNIPWTETNQRDHVDIENSVFVFEDKNNNVLSKQYKFNFTSADTMEVYCYKNGKTYTMTRN